MKKELKDCLHLYLGCDMLHEDRDPFILSYYWLNHISNKNSWELYKPILRPLSDMTEEEAIECGLGGFGYRCLKKGILSYCFSAKTFSKLLSKHFDLFGLIESGLAIDKTTLK